MTRAHVKDSIIDYALIGAFLAAIMFFGTGCSGMEVGGRLGIYRVDERQDSSRTYRANIPLKCYFVNCTASAEDVQGS